MHDNKSIQGICIIHIQFKTGILVLKILGFCDIVGSVEPYF